MIPHRLWAQLLVGEAQQKVLKVYEGGDVHEILITSYQDQAGSQDSTAEPTGYAVSVTYKVSPDLVIFNHVYPTEKEAADVFQDVVTAAAGVESLIKQQKLDEAAAATKTFLDKMRANTSETPVEVEAASRLAENLYATVGCQNAMQEVAAKFPGYNNPDSPDHRKAVDYVLDAVEDSNPGIMNDEIEADLMDMVSAGLS